MRFKTAEEIDDEVREFSGRMDSDFLRRYLKNLYLDKKELQEREDKDSEIVQNNIKNYELYIEACKKYYKKSWVFNAMRSACLYKNEEELAEWLKEEERLEKEEREAEKLLKEQNKAGNQTQKGPNKTGNQTPKVPNKTDDGAR